MVSRQDIAAALGNLALPPELRASIPALASMIIEALAGASPRTDDPQLLALVNVLREQQLQIGGNTLTVGNVTGEGIAVGDNATSIVLHVSLTPPPNLPPALHQLRAPSGDFVDRNEEIETLVQVLLDEPTGKRGAVARISGLAGIGKTELAYSVADRVKDHFPHAQLVVDLRGSILNRELRPEQALHRIIQSFNPLYPALDDLDQLRGIYRALVSDKRVLILADDALDVNQVRPLIPPPGSALLITSRNSIMLPNLKPQHLHALPIEHAVNLLTAICSRINGHAAKLAGLCGRLPLALRVSATFLLGRPDRDVGEYTRSLETERERLKKLREPRDKLLNVEASLRLSYDALDSELQSALRQMGVFTSPFDIAAAEAIISRTDERPLNELLDDLQYYSLLDFDEQATRYELHELVRVFALDQLQEAGEEYETRLRHARFYAQRASEIRKQFEKGGPHTLQALRLFDLDRPRISSGWRWARTQEPPSDVTDALLVDYGFATMTIGELRYDPRADRLKNFGFMLEAARRLGKANRVGIALFNLGRAHAALGDFHQAIAYFEQDLQITCEIENRKGEGIALGNLGLAYAELGYYEKAVVLHHQNLDIARAVKNRKGESISLGNLGYALTLAGKAEQALDHHYEQLAITIDLQDQFEESVARSYIGLALIESGRPKEAFEWLGQALALARKLGDLAAEGRILDRQGRAHAVLGESDRALECYDQSVNIARELGDAAGEARTKWRKGEVLVKRHDPAQGIQLMQEAIDYWRRIGHLEAENRADYLASITNDDFPALSA